MGIEALLGASNPLGWLSLGMGFLKDAQSLRINKEQSDLKTPAGLRAAAEKAGFNPLVFAAPGTVGGYAPIFSQGVENAISTLEATKQANLDREMRQQEIEQENRRLKLLAQSLTLTDGQRVGPYGNSEVPPPKMHPVGIQDESTTLSMEGISPEGPTGDPITIDPSIKIGPIEVVENPWFSSAQEAEDRYGEPVSWGWGALVLTADVVATGLHYMGKGYDAYKKWYDELPEEGKPSIQAVSAMLLKAQQEKRTTQPRHGGVAYPNEIVGRFGPPNGTYVAGY